LVWHPQLQYSHVHSHVAAALLLHTTPCRFDIRVQPSLCLYTSARSGDCACYVTRAGRLQNQPRTGFRGAHLGMRSTSGTSLQYISSISGYPGVGTPQPVPERAPNSGLQRDEASKLREVLPCHSCWHTAVVPVSNHSTSHCGHHRNDFAVQCGVHFPAFGAHLPAGWTRAECTALPRCVVSVLRLLVSGYSAPALADQVHHGVRTATLAFSGVVDPDSTQRAAAPEACERLLA
jgi:hypothetical protein